MALIGMLHHRKDPRKVIKSYAFAAVAKAEGVDFVYFSPKRVNFNDESILGYVYENGNWLERKTRFPDVIYNAGSPEKLAKSNTILRELGKRIPFTTHSVGNKMSVYKRLQSARLFSPYLIPSHVIEQTETVTRLLDAYQSIIIKPVNGRKGRNIVLVEKISNGMFNVTQHLKCSTCTANQLNDLIGLLMQEEPYLAQPYIRCKTKSGFAFDFRLHVQKNGEGQWVMAAIYPRLAPYGSVICNIGSGGYTNRLQPFLRLEYGEYHHEIQRSLEQFALALAYHLDDLQHRPLDELGIDVGLDINHKIWLYEVNWRPGAPPAFNWELDVVKNTIHYAVYLANQAKGKMIKKQ